VKKLPIQLGLFMFIRTVFNSAYRMIYAFLPIFGRGLGVDIKSMSLALTTRSVVSSLGPFAASVSDVRGRKFGMLLGLTLFTGGTALVVFFPTFPMFVISLVLATTGKYVFDPGMQAYLGDRIDYRERGRILAITEFGWSLAFILGIPLAGYLIALQGWMAPFRLFALLGLVTILALFLALPTDRHEERANHGLVKNFRTVLTFGPALLALGVGLLISTANEVINVVFGVWLDESLKTWVGPDGFGGIFKFLNFFKTTLGLDIALLILAAIVIGLSELCAEGLVARFVDRLGKPRAVALGLIVNSLSALLLPVLGKTTSGALFGLFMFYISFEFSLVSLIPMMTEIMPQTRATLMAFTVSALSLGRASGALLAPYLYSAGLMVSGAAAVVFNGMALVLLRRFIRQDKNG
jgi:predicted MFS family arabinose efflux permease